MLNIIDFFAEDFVAIVIVFFVLLAAVAFTLVGKKSVGVLGGLLRVILSLFSSPILYIRKAMQELADYKSGGQTQATDNKQYLLIKFLSILQALLIIISIVILAVGVVSAWNQLIPSKQLRTTISAIEQELNTLKSELQESEPAAKQMEAEWSTRHDLLISAYQKERAQRVEKLTTENSDLAVRINSMSDTAQQAFSEIRSYHTQNEYIDQPSSLESPIKEITNYIEKQTLPRETKSLLHKYNTNWYATVLSRFDIAAFSENQVLCAAYPEYYMQKQRITWLKESIPAQEKDLATYRSEQRYNFEAFGLQILLSLLLVIFTVWIIGLLIEALWLSVSMAANIQKISEQGKK